MFKFYFFAKLIVVVSFQFCLLTFNSLFANTPLIVIDKSLVRTINVAVVPFVYSENTRLLETNISEIIRNDITLSGQLKTISQKDFISIPKKEEDIIYTDWEEINAEFLLIGKITQGDSWEEYKMQITFFDIGTREMSFKYNIKFKKNRVRVVGHRISDIIFKHITGLEGIFSTKIAYVTQKGHGRLNRLYNLKISDLDGKNSKSVLTTKNPIISPTFSPDGKTIAYTLLESKGSRIYIQEIVTGKRKLLSSKKQTLSPAFSPDGKYLAFSMLDGEEDYNIYVLDILKNKVSALDVSYGIQVEPSWDPIEKFIYFTSDSNGSPRVMKKSLALLAKKSILYPRLSVNPQSLNKKVLFIALDVGRKFNVFSWDKTTKKTIQITFDDNVEDIAVSPNRQYILYSVDNVSRSDIKLLHLKTNHTFKIEFEDKIVREPTWSPNL